MHPILVVLLISVFIAYLGVGIITPNMPVYATQLGATGIMLGLIIGAFSVSRGVLQPVVGALSDRSGRKRFLVVGMGLYSACGLLYPLATTVEHLIVIRCIHGAGSAMTIPMAMAIIGDLAPSGQEGRYMGLLNVAMFAGIGGGPLLGGLASDLWGMDSAFYAMSLLSIIATVLVITLLPARSRNAVWQKGEGLLSVFRRMLGNIRVLGILLSRMATMTVMLPTMGFLPILMTRAMGSTGLEIGIVMATRTIINAVGQPPFGRMADRYNKVMLLAVGSLLMTVAMFLVPFARTFQQLIPLFMMLGLGEAVVWPVLGAFAVEEGRTYGQGSMMGVFNMAMSIGMLIGSIVTGFLMDVLGLGFAFFSISLIMLVCTLIACRLILAGENRRLVLEVSMADPDDNGNCGSG